MSVLEVSISISDFFMYEFMLISCPVSEASSPSYADYFIPKQLIFLLGSIEKQQCIL